jgi:hypothetical protein
LWWSVLLVEETRVPGENHWPVASHYCCIDYTLPWTGFELKTLVVLGTDYTGSCKSNYHTITTTTAPALFWFLMYTWLYIGHLMKNKFAI